MSVMEAILAYLSGRWFTALASVASILSLVISAAVLINVRKIRSFYVFTARVPQLLDRLRTNSSSLSDQLNDFDRFRPQIPVLLADTEVALVSLSKKVRSPHNGVARALALRVKEYDVKADGEGPLREIYVDLHKVIATIDDLREDLKWER